ncbi:hypothetical protein NM208_g7787 [Fusarium decemcellulare]|uniref:Uncharacterized protein n=1 Tax=Fusarium decemcellulare TaxID=57161 RepID=A0ACC1S7Q7_9HYPO|nr:hypothetical protein NM208_g7787 [Fusarium decemcellulare]
MTSIDHYQHLVSEFDSGNIPLLVAAAINYAVGLGQYFYTIRLMLRDGKGPLPFWMHSFYLAHDSYMCYTFGQAAPLYDHHWFISGTSTAMLIWSSMEIWAIHRTITTDRDGTFASLLGPNPSLSKVLGFAFAFQVAMYGVMLLGPIFMGDTCFMQWFCITNIVMAIGSVNETLQRGSRKGLSRGFSFITVIGTVGTFSPWGFWALALPEIFANPAYYGVGAILSLYSVWGLITVSRY